MKSNISKYIVIRYSLLQLPGIIFLAVTLIVIQRWIVIPGMIFWGILICWAIKDVILFFYTWRAYEWKQKDKMIGNRGITIERIIRSGYIYVNGEKWYAENHSGSPIDKGQKVFVYDRKGLILFIKDINNEVR